MLYSVCKKGVIMYDIVREFITNSLFNTTCELNGLDLILTDVSMVLIYVVLVSMLVWIFNVVRGALSL